MKSRLDLFTRFTKQIIQPPPLNHIIITPLRVGNRRGMWFHRRLQNNSSSTGRSFLRWRTPRSRGTYPYRPLFIDQSRSTNNNNNKRSSEVLVYQSHQQMSIIIIIFRIYVTDYYTAEIKLSSFILEEFEYGYNCFKKISGARQTRTIIVFKKNIELCRILI